MTRWQFWLLMAAFAACGIATIVQARADQPTCLAMAQSIGKAQTGVTITSNEPQNVVEAKALQACKDKGGTDCRMIWSQCSAGGSSLGKQGWKNP